jgi:hypothetical protein
MFSRKRFREKKIKKFPRKFSRKKVHHSIRENMRKNFAQNFFAIKFATIFFAIINSYTFMIKILVNKFRLFFGKGPPCWAKIDQIFSLQDMTIHTPIDSP